MELRSGKKINTTKKNKIKSKNTNIEKNEKISKNTIYIVTKFHHKYFKEMINIKDNIL